MKTKGEILAWGVPRQYSFKALTSKATFVLDFWWWIFKYQWMCKCIWSRISMWHDAKVFNSMLKYTKVKKKKSTNAKSCKSYTKLSKSAGKWNGMVS